VHARCDTAPGGPFRAGSGRRARAAPTADSSVRTGYAAHARPV